MRRPDTLSSAPTSTRRLRSALAAAALALTTGLSLVACATPPTATPEPPPVTALPEPATVVPVTDTPVVTATATITPTATTTEIVPTQVPTVAVVAPSPVAAQPTAAVAPPPAAATANSGAPVIDFYPDNGQFEVDKDQMCIAVNWHTENVTNVRLEWGGKTIDVAASGRQPDICFGEKKIELKLIYKFKDGREESRTIEVKHKG